MIVIVSASSEIDVYDIAVQYENSKDKAQQEKHTQEVFGAHRQPKLQKLEYRVRILFTRWFIDY